MLAALWVVAGALLWRTRVPAGLDLPELDAADYFSSAQLRRAERYESFLRFDFLAASLVHVATAACVALYAPSVVRRLRGGPVARGVQLAFGTLLLLWLVRLPFGLAAHSWRRRFDIAREGYLEWLVRPWPTLAAETLLACVAVAALMLLAAHLGRRWWLAGAAAVAVLGSAYVLVQPLVLAPRFAPLDDPALATEIERLARSMDVGEVEVRLRKAAERTRAANAEVVGIGPTRRIVLWDTLLEGEFNRTEVRALAAHELGHVAERHVWKGLGWFLLAVGPLLFLLDRAARWRGGLTRPDAVPVVIAAVLALQLLLAPAVNAVSRRYEAEADWVALEATGDPEAMRQLLRGLAVRNLADPEPPAWWTAAFRTHPSIVDRIAMAEAWAADRGQRLPPPTAEAFRG